MSEQEFVVDSEIVPGLTPGKIELVRYLEYGSPTSYPVTAEALAELAEDLSRIPGCSDLAIKASVGSILLRGLEL